MDRELKGNELLLYLMSRFNMTYNNAVREMVIHKQDMEFLKVKESK